MNWKHHTRSPTRNQHLEFGKFLRELRLEEGMGLREFSRLVGENPTSILNIESGRQNPPRQKERLVEFARCLNVDEGSLNWQRLFQLADSDFQVSRLVDETMQRPLVAGIVRTTDGHCDGQLERLISRINQQRKEVAG